MLKENGTELSKVRADKAMIEEGDIILYSTNTRGHIDNIMLVWDAKSNINDLN